MVPEGWRITRLGKVVTISSGESPSSFSFSQAGKYPYVKVEDLNSDAKYLSRSRTFTDDERNPIPAGSIVFPKRGAAIATNKVRITSIPLYIDTNLMALRPNTDELDAEYLYYWIQHSRLFRIADTSSIPQINNKHITPMQIPLPRLEQQIEVRQLLSTWDRSIVTLEHLLQKKQQLKHGLMQQLLTGKRRFSEFVRSSAVQHTRFGSRPKEWPLRKIGGFAHEVIERNGSHGDWPVLSCTKHQGLVDSLTYFGKRIHSEDTSHYKVVRRGQFAYATNHIEEGSIGLLSDREAGLVSPMYTVFDCDKTVDPQFLFFLFKTELYRHIFQATTNASVNRRGSLRWKQFSQLLVATPSIEEQKKITLCLGECDRELALLHRQFDLLKIQKRGLMQKLLTGQVRVKV